MAKSNPRRKPTIRVQGPVHSLNVMDAWDLASWMKFYTEFAKQEGVDVDDVKLDITNYDDDYAECHLYVFREQTQAEIVAEKQAKIERENAHREHIRKQIASLAEQYPELMPYQVQELP